MHLFDCLLFYLNYLYITFLNYFLYLFRYTFSIKRIIINFLLITGIFFIFEIIIYNLIFLFDIIFIFNWFIFIFLSFIINKIIFITFENNRSIFRMRSLIKYFILVFCNYLFWFINIILDFYFIICLSN